MLDQVLARIVGGREVVVVDADGFGVVLQRRANHNIAQAFVVQILGDGIVFLGIQQNKRDLAGRLA